MPVRQQDSPGLWRSLTGAFTLMGLFLHPSRTRSRAVYDLLSISNHLGEKSLYLNYGYWDGAGTYDEACEAMAHVLGEAAQLSSEDQVLDVGFGFADQDIYWTKTFSPRRIVGLNITPSQVAVAAQRIKVQQLEERIEPRVGSATQMPVDDNSCDKVTALETAFHFNTREDFFHEAFRVLHPGGRLAMADIIPKAWPLPGIKLRMMDFGLRAMWQVPRANMYTADVYENKMRRSGFTNIHIRSIDRWVWAPFAAYAYRRLGDPEIVRRMNPVLRILWRVGLLNQAIFIAHDYVIVTADKPGPSEPAA